MPRARQKRPRAEPPRDRPDAPEGPQKRRRGGGGGAGFAKPKRSDPDRQRKVAWVPGQQEGLRAANAIFYSPSKKMQACREQRAQEKHHAVCPLSPVEARPCSTPECHCKLSHSQLNLRLSLGDIKQVRPPPPPPPFCCPGCAAPAAAARR